MQQVFNKCSLPCFFSFHMIPVWSRRFCEFLSSPTLCYSMDCKSCISSPFPRFGKFSAIISLKKLPAPFSLLSFWDTHCLMLLFLTESNISSGISLFFKALNSLTFSTCIICRFLSYNFLILPCIFCSISSAF